MTLKPFLLCISLCFPLAASAASYHDLSTIKKQVSDYLYSLPDIQLNKESKITVHAIDSRLKLAACESLNFKLASGSHLMGKTSVHVICSAPKAWSFYLTASISRYDEVMVLNGSFKRGHIISEGDIYASRKDLSTLPFGYITEKNVLIGKQLKRHLQAGKILTPSHVTNPIIIKRGEMVALQTSNSGFMVRMKGTAMSDGAIGDKIRVKNSSSNRIIEGEITSHGIVTIGK
ncbi:MAG: flagellar basal body P-ring formation chaperone FlgA [Gammaproteobacteria bacterium]|nr:flagellar basal body P-ring formation chaperone FlgA [Gammaproteobacteria bacterium]